MMFATAQAIIADAFPPGRRGAALGWYSVVVALGLSAGPTLGGLITEYFDWRWVFYVNLPVGMVAFVASRAYLGAAARREGPRRPARQVRFCRGGTPRRRLRGVPARADLRPVLGLDVRTPGGLHRHCGGIVLGRLRVERHAARPVVDLDLLRTPAFGGALLSTFLATLALFAVGFMCPFYFEEHPRLFGGSFRAAADRAPIVDRAGRPDQRRVWPTAWGRTGSPPAGSHSRAPGWPCSPRSAPRAPCRKSCSR